MELGTLELKDMEEFAQLVVNLQYYGGAGSVVFTAEFTTNGTYMVHFKRA